MPATANMHDEGRRDLLASIAELIERVLSDSHDAVSGLSFSRELWCRLGTEISILAAALPEALGGAGGGAVVHLVLAEAFGRHLVAQPYVSALVMAPALLGADSQRFAELLGKAARGDTIIVPALGDGPGDHVLRANALTAIPTDGKWHLNGTKVLVRDAPMADCFVVLARTGSGDDDYLLALVPADAAGLTREDFATIDAGSGSHLTFTGVEIDSPAVLTTGRQARERAVRAVDEAIVAVCAEGVGVMKAMLGQCTDYARQRVQFGRPISEFQVLQHRMVDMLAVIEQAESITRLASTKLEGADRAMAVSGCMALVARACRTVSQDAVQIHGAVGIAAETPISRYFRRALAIELQFGGREHHLMRYIEAAT